MKFQLERILLFSDAVFAIAITMMIIEIKPPHLEDQITFSKAFNALMSKLPVFIGNLISFYMIALYWYRHHDMMQHVQSYNTKFLLINFGLLLSVSMIPFSTTFVFENILARTSLPYVVYNLNHIICSALSYRLASYSLNPKNGLCESTPAAALHNFKLHTVYAIILFVTIGLFSFINPALSPILYSLFGLQDLILRKWIKKV